MKKFIFFFFLSFSLYSQKFDGYVVTNTNDTITCKFFVETNLFNKKMLYPSSNDQIKILNSKGEKLKYKTHEIKSFLIKETDRGDYKFVTIKDDPKHFYHEVVTGKLSYYFLYKSNYQGGFPLASGYIVKDGKLYRTDSFNKRNNFGELIVDYPELYQKWMDSNNYFKISQLSEVIQLYNEHFK